MKNKERKEQKVKRQKTKSLLKKQTKRTKY